MTGEGHKAPCPADSLFFELMDFTYTLAVQLGLSPFAVLDQDKDRVIMLINYFIEKGDKEQPKATVAKNATVKSSRYDGFWDF
jgi:hypothetical protein